MVISPSTEIPRTKSRHGNLLLYFCKTVVTLAKMYPKGYEKVEDTRDCEQNTGSCLAGRASTTFPSN